MNYFKYDIVTLIELVESKPCIWDKTDDNHKNKQMREKSWQEIFEFLEDNYAQMNLFEKKKTGEMIMNKWTNIRDSFMRSLRTKSGQAVKKSYMYNEHLQFLLKVVQKDVTESNYSKEIDEENSSQSSILNESEPDLSQKQPGTSTTKLPTKNKKAKVTTETDNLEREILAELKRTKSPEYSQAGPYSTHSDCEILLLSFLPYVRDMNEMELMELQMETLKTIKNIKQKRTTKDQIFESRSSFANGSIYSDQISLEMIDDRLSPKVDDQPKQKYTVYLEEFVDEDD